MVKRLSIALSAGLILALVDIWLASASVLGALDTSGPLFWYMLFNRLAIGFFVALVGVITIHPLFGFNMYLIRGAFTGIWISLSMAISVFFDTQSTWTFFWLILISGGVYGIIIDALATKFAGHGKALLHPRNE